MPNYVETQYSVSDVLVEAKQSGDELLTFGGSATYARGTILARDSVSGKLVPFVKGGSTNQNGIPKAVLANEATRATAGDLAVRVWYEAELRKYLTIIAADGDDSNIDSAVKDQLRDYGIILTETTVINGV